MPALNRDTPALLLIDFQSRLMLAIADGPAHARPRGCLGLFLGGVLGAVSGAVLAFVLGEPIGIAFNIENCSTR